VSKRLYTQTVVVGCQAGRSCQGKCKKTFNQCKPVWDAEAFARYHLDRAFERFPAGAMYLRDDEYEDSLSALIFHLVRMEKTFDHDRNDSFEGFAKTYLPKRAVDVGPRRVLGRNGNKLHNYLFEEFGEAVQGAGSGGFDTQVAQDPDVDWGADERELQSRRNRRILAAASLLGLAAPDLAA
jgi:hypothetical protein